MRLARLVGLMVAGYGIGRYMAYVRALERGAVVATAKAAGVDALRERLDVAEHAQASALARVATLDSALSKARANVEDSVRQLMASRVQADEQRKTIDGWRARAIAAEARLAVKDSLGDG